MLPLKDVNPSRSFPIVTVSIIAVCVLVFIMELVFGPKEVVLRYGAIPYEVLTGKDVPPPDGVPTYLTPLTSMFLHGDIFHLFFNMLFLWIFGDNVEDAFGSLNFLIFYLVSGVGAFIVHTLIYLLFKPSYLTVPTIGASGAISGVLAAYMLLYPSARVLTLVTFGFFIDFIEVPAYIFIGFWFLTQIINGLLGLFNWSSVAWFAHIGGFLVGWLLTWIFMRRRSRRYIRGYAPEFWWDDYY